MGVLDNNGDSELSELLRALLSLDGRQPAPANPFAVSGLGALIAAPRLRTRADWNARFEHWQRPFSVTEENSIGRAQRAVLRAVSANAWLTYQGVRVDCQGSYHNNTNVRREADIDLRVTHPLLKVDYDANVIPEYGRQAYSYVDGGITYGDLFRRLRGELNACLSSAFGRRCVSTGNKAITIEGFTTSGAKVDVVPAVKLHKVGWDQSAARFTRLEGVAILSSSGSWTENFPDQHHANGKAKRARTRHRFKRTVRIFKRLQADMIERGTLPKRAPSFLVECLVHAVEDEHFLVETDDLYGRTRRISHRMHDRLGGVFAPVLLREINGIKPLFGAGQAWSQADARAFAEAVVAHLGNA